MTDRREVSKLISGRSPECNTNMHGTRLPGSDRTVREHIYFALPYSYVLRNFASALYSLVGSSRKTFRHVIVPLLVFCWCWQLLIVTVAPTFDEMVDTCWIYEAKGRD